MGGRCVYMSLHYITQPQLLIHLLFEQYLYSESTFQKRISINGFKNIKHLSLSTPVRKILLAPTYTFVSHFSAFVYRQKFYCFNCTSIGKLIQHLKVDTVISI